MLFDDLEAEPRMTVARLEVLYRQYCLRKNFTREVAEAVASGSAALERAGAWLLMRVAREPGGLPAGDWEIVVNGLDGVRAWTARLQLCQLLAGQPALVETAPDEIEVVFAEPRPAPATGQAVVLYDDDIVLAGGWITAVELGGGTADEVAARLSRFVQTLTQVAGRYGRTPLALESADLRHADGYALRLRGVTTTEAKKPDGRK